MATEAAKQDRALAEEIEREHESVREAVRTLREEIGRLHHEPGPGHTAGRLGGMLGMFRVHLSRHFALEEQGRFLGAAQEARNPGTQRTVEALVRDHRGFERELGRLLDAAQRAESGVAGLTEQFVAALEEFLRRLEQHERVENELVQEIVNRDTGGLG